MLSSPIQSAPGFQSSNSAVNALSPAPAEATDLGKVAATASSADNNILLPSDLLNEPGNELFSGQLNEAMVSAEQIPPEAAGEQPAQQGQEHSEPSAEEWLLAMLDQQQLQLQARDNSAIAPAGITAAPQLTPDAVELTVSQKPASVGSPENTGAEKNTASPASVLLSKEQINSDKIVENPLNKTGDAQHKKIITPFVLANANTAPVIDTRADTGSENSSTALTNTNSSALINSSAANTIALTTAVAVTDISNNPLAAPGAVGESSVKHSAPAQLNLHTPEAKWGEQLLHILRDNVQVQIQQRIQNATIRLDPPELGSLEIYLSHEAGRLNVHITASQADVARLIQHTSDRLRQELTGPQFTQVNVQTSAEGQGGQQQSRERPRFANDERILANESPVVNGDQPANRTSDVLVTV